MGAQSFAGQFGSDRRSLNLALRERRVFRDLIEGTTHSYLVVDPRPGLRIVDINDSYASATMTRRGKVAGNRLFEVFPDNPQLPDADGVSNLFQSFCRVAQTGRAHAMADQRYDIPGKDGQFVERHWRIVNTPIFDDADRLIYLLHHVIDVTEQVSRVRPKPIFDI